MLMLPSIALVALRQDLKDTNGKTYAQILAMGRSRWHDFFVGKDGGSTAAESSAEGIYGDALAWRNGKLLKGHPSPLRKALQAFKNDAIDAGTAVTGGGTMWNITAGSLYADAEQTLYAVLTHSGRAPHRKVSDAQRAVATLRHSVMGIGTDDKENRKQGLAAMDRLDADLLQAVALAAKLPRRDSDEVLEFCRSTAAGVNEQASPK